MVNELESTLSRLEIGMLSPKETAKRSLLTSSDCRVEFEEASALDLDTLQGVRKWICGVA